MHFGPMQPVALITPNAKEGFDIPMGEQRHGRILLLVLSKLVADLGRQTRSCPATSPRLQHPPVPH